MRYVLIVFFGLLCSVSLFVNTKHMMDSQIIPKCILSLGVAGLMGMIYAIFIIGGRKIYWTFRIISIIIVVHCIIESCIGILQFCNILVSSSHIYRVIGTFDNPAGFAACLCVGLPFALFFCTNPTNQKRYWIAYSIPFLLLLLFFSESRSGIISTISIILLFAINQSWKHIFQKKKRFLFYICLFILIGILFIILYFWKKDSADGRLLIWKCVWKMIENKPIIGHGTAAFKEYYMDYQAAFFNQFPNSKFTLLADNVISPFNEYLSICIQFGVLGLLILIALFIILIYCYTRQPSIEAWVSLLSLLSLSIFSMFSYPFTYPFVWIIAILCIFYLLWNTIGDFFLTERI